MTRRVGQTRLELPTSRLSGVRSNHLSYRPVFTQRRRTTRRVRVACTTLSLVRGFSL